MSDPDIQQVLEDVYWRLLHHPDDEWRLRNQSLYASVRDAIASLREEEPEAVQCRFERIAGFNAIKNGAGLA